ncbi:MAG: site-specific DNA-methyltransferase [Bacteroidales bacterium]|jgi:DNA modification methylase|nr:site-specific DNA-methyltransferase [Bacteroidales bacterium]
MTKQYYKSLYFSDYPSKDANGRSVTVAFNEPEMPYFTRVKDLTTPEVKDLIGYVFYDDIVKLAKLEERSINQTIKRLIKQNVEKQNKKYFTEKDVTFSNSKNIPFQRWYPYIEGYSPDFVKSLIEEYKINDCVVYEPFAGTGTTIFAADQCGLKTVYSEVNPLLQFLTQVKINVLKESQKKRKVISNELKKISANIFETLNSFSENIELETSYIQAFGKSKYFSKDTFSKILKLRTYIDFLYLKSEELVADLLSIAVFSSLLSVSLLKKNGDVRFRTKEEIAKGEMKILEDVLPKKIEEIASDLLCADFSMKTKPEFILSNSKKTNCIHDLKIGAIITSPPYLNGTNYFRNTKIELWFLRYLQNENDLRLFRDQALTSGINDVKREYASQIANEKVDNCKLLSDTLLELEQKSYDSRIQLMVKCYFYEMFQVFNNVKNHLQKNAKILIDLGDSIFCGVHVKTDKILIDILQKIGYKLIDTKVLRKRRSKNNEILSQVLIVFNYNQQVENNNVKTPNYQWQEKWNDIKTNLPYQKEPFSKKNWGNPNHSLCSYQGKLKPAIANHLVTTFVPEGGTFLDLFSGVGTIPFEGALTGRKAYGIDISKPAYYISSAKVGKSNPEDCFEIIFDLENYINLNKSNADFNRWKNFGFNKTLQDYYEPQTFSEILSARDYFIKNQPKTTEEMLVISALLHILHGNRPYALSRRSHPIVPYAPTGNFEYKILTEKLKEKVLKSLKVELPDNFTNGKIFLQDTTKIWSQEITDLDAIITSPPFFDSTRFYLANWIRIWFAGWGIEDFKYQPRSFVEEKQKIDFSIYEPIFRQAKERLKKDGVFVLHLGKSVKCDMAKELQKVAKRWFKTADLFDESVAHCQTYGIKDIGTVTSHQYLVLV